MKRILLVVLASCVLACPFPASAAEEVKITPLYTESFGAAVGYVYSIVGSPQPQSALMATAMIGTKGSAMAFLMGRDIRVFGADRLFMDPIVSSGYFVDNNAFINGNPAFHNERAGSNESDRNNYVIGSGWDNYFRITFKYLLPIGNGKDQVVNAYRIKGGLLESGATGGTSWNPLESGRTYLQVRPFFRSQQINSNFVDSVQRTNGLDYNVYWDNREFPVNPSKGNSLLLKDSQDYGWGNSSNPWTV